MKPTRAARDASAAVVAGIAAVASYAHMRALALDHGQSELIASLVPVSVDGLLVVSTVTMADDMAAGRKAPPTAVLAFIVDVAASIVANTLAAPPDVLSRCVSAWPSVALVLVVEVLARPGRPVPAADKTPAKARVSSNGQVRTSKRATAAVRLEKARTRNPDASLPELARTAKVSERHARRLLAGQET